MDKTVKFKNGCVKLSENGIEISKHGYIKLIPFNEITEIRISKPSLLNYGVLQIFQENDNDYYVPLLDKRGVITFGLTDSIIIARLRYKIEKEAGIDFSNEFYGLEMNIMERLRLISPTYLALILCLISFISLNRNLIIAGLYAIFNGDLAAVAFGNNGETSFAFLMGSIIGSVLMWFLMWLKSTFDVNKAYKVVANKSSVSTKFNV